MNYMKQVAQMLGVELGEEFNIECYNGKYKIIDTGIYFFDEEDNLVVDGYMRNFTGHNIKNITGNITVATVTGDNVGGAYFEFPVEEFGVLKNGHSRPWRLIFHSDYVNIEIVDLSEFTVTTEFEFYKE